MRLRPGTWRLRAFWRLHVGVALAFGLFSSGLAALVALTLVINAVTVPACEAATPALPDFEVAPFSFDPEARALALGQALVNDDVREAYDMLAPEVLQVASLCEIGLENFRSLTGDGQTDVALDRTLGGEAQAARSVGTDEGRAPVFGFDPSNDLLSVSLQLTPRQFPENPVSYVRVTFLRDGRVNWIGLDQAMTELGPLRVFPAPAYADEDAFEETAVVVGRAPWELGGTLTVPRGHGPFPAVVLVHGSGFADRDATVGATKGARDLAWGLASRGVATLRYDKRTLTHALAFARQPDFTIDDELVNDALAAGELLRQTPRIDPARIYVLGVSLGGVAAPRIAQRDPTIAGLILYSAPSGMLWEDFAEQRQRRLKADGVVSAADERRLGLVRARAAAMEALAAGSPAPHMKVRPSHFLDRADYRPEAVARDLPIPMLILHSLNDELLSGEEIVGWVASLRRRDDVVFRLYREHTHSLLDRREVTGPDLRPEVHVGSEVISDIASWVAGERPARTCVDLQAWHAGCRGGPSAAFHAD